MLLLLPALPGLEKQLPWPIKMKGAGFIRVIFQTNLFLHSNPMRPIFLSKKQTTASVMAVAVQV